MPGTGDRSLDGALVRMTGPCGFAFGSLRLRRRFGYRPLHFLLKKDGLAMNQKQFRRLYREEGLQVRKRGGRKQALGFRAPLGLPSRPNERAELGNACRLALHPARQAATI